MCSLGLSRPPHSCAGGLNISFRPQLRLLGEQRALLPKGEGYAHQEEKAEQASARN